MINQRKSLEPLLDWRLWLPPAVMAIFLIAVAQYNFLMFHTFAELFAIVISFLIFTFAWSTRSFSRNDFLLFLACGYFWIGSLDLIHTLAYKGMDVFVEGSGNLSTQFWIAARFCEAALLLAAPLAALRRQNGYLLFAAFGAVAVGLTALILSGTFPTGFVEGTGLTDFKIYSEYLIDIILALALVSLFRYGRNIAMGEKVLIAAAIVLTMCAELAFTFYVDVYGFSNLVGHILKLFSFWLIFQAIVVSHLKEPYAALQKSEEQSRSLFDNAEISIWNVDLSEIHKALNKLRQDGVTNLRQYLKENEHAVRDMVSLIRVAQVNQATLTLFEATDEDEFRRLFDRVFERDPFEVLTNVLSALWDGGTVFRSEAALQTLKGGPLEGIVSFRIPETDFGFRSVPISIVNISDRKRTEALMLAAKDEAETANLAKSEFLGSMSHELRTPLNAILGFAQVLKSDLETVLSVDQNKQFEHIVDAGNHLLKLVNQILDLSRIEANEMDLTLEDVNASKITADCVNLMALLGEAQRIEIVNELSAAAAVYVFADQLRLRQVLINLLSNAVKYNQDGGVVTVRGLETEDGFFRLSVTDTGIGIAEEKHARVFLMLDRLGVDIALVSEGAGIGLAVAKLLVENMGGQIGFESQKGAGSTFWFELPLASNQDALGQPQ